MATNPHIYVSSVVGTNTGATDTSQASQQTGNITSMTASDVYTTLHAAVTGCAPSDGDIIYVCDNHSATYDPTAITKFNLSGVADGAGLSVISVDSTAIDSFKAGAYERQTGGDNFEFWGTGKWDGVDIDTYKYWRTYAEHWEVLNCRIGVAGNGDVFYWLSNDGASVTFNNVTFHCFASSMPSNGSAFIIVYGSKALFYNCTIENGTYTVGGRLLTDFAGGGGYVEMHDCDLTGLTGASSLIMTGQSSSAGDVANVKLYNCELSSSLATIATLYGVTQRFEMYGTDDSTGGLIHRFHVQSGVGLAVNNDSVYVTANQPWHEGSAKSSINVTTESSCSHIHPFEFEIPQRYVNLASTSTDKISVNIVTDFTLNDTDIAFFMSYPDGTTAVQSNLISVQADSLATPSALNTTGALAAGDWTGEPASPNFYKVDLDTSADAGQATAVSIRCEVYKASITGTTGGYLYIDPILTVGT